MTIKFKKGQAAGAAVLLVIIAVILVGFIVLVSPSERAKILGETEEDNSTSATSIKDSVVRVTLLKESPGRIDYLTETEIEHPLPVINIYTKTEATVLDERNVAYAKRGIFSEEEAAINFKIADLEHTKNVLLNFKVVNSEDQLIVTLNEEEVYRGELSAGLIQPISLPENLLQEQNLLVFSVSSPGAAFWATNEVTLEDLKIIGEVTSVEAQYSRNVFLVSEAEAKNLEKLVLKFQPECVYSKVGVLTITVNGHEIYNAVPDCDIAMVPIEFSSDLIFQGENEIEFRTARGTYLLSHVMIESKLKELDFPTYYFDLTNQQYEDVYSDKLRLRLRMDFVDVITTKYGEVIFNGHTEHFDTKEAYYVLDLSDDAVKGTNSLKLRPQKTIEVRELKIDLVK